MNPGPQTCCTAFAGFQTIAHGDLQQVTLKVREVIDLGEQAPILIFDDFTGKTIEVDFRGTTDDVRKRLGQMAGADEPASSSLAGEEAPRKAGRPKLGVIAREVTLLPRHWDWLSSQPGGASVALRKLVDEARRASGNKDRVRQAQEVAYRFMSALAGNLPGFEEVTRALFAGDRANFLKLIKSWPNDVGKYVKVLAAPAFESAGTPEP